MKMESGSLIVGTSPLDNRVGDDGDEGVEFNLAVAADQFDIFRRLEGVMTLIVRAGRWPAGSGMRDRGPLRVGAGRDPWSQKLG